MIVQDVLSTKGRTVVTVRPDATLTELVATLAENSIGAAVVSQDGSHIAGIVSERDIARALHRHGAGVVDLPVRDLMTADVRTCEIGDQVRDIAGVMTEGRFRHLPVVDDGKLVGIVSIGDIVKKRIDELEAEANQLMDYLSS